uniref:Uncharacterized protein n=1 Tax=Rhizophora mucronata TaxID=61149 RepID=A0A2P2QWJ8_RHIMU
MSLIQIVNGGFTPTQAISTKGQRRCSQRVVDGYSLGNSSFTKGLIHGFW